MCCGFLLLCTHKQELWAGFIIWPQDEGFGISSGLSINMMFSRQEGVPGLGVPIIHNAEVAPSIDDTSKESQLSVLSLSCGEYLTVCNK